MEVVKIKNIWLKIWTEYILFF